jgi:hypothetical protein
MMPESLSNAIEACAELIEGIEDLEILQKSQVSRLKGKLRLLDGSILWFREVWAKGEMVAYN